MEDDYGVEEEETGDVQVTEGEAHPVLKPAVTRCRLEPFHFPLMSTFEYIFCDFWKKMNLIKVDGFAAEIAPESHAGEGAARRLDVDRRWTSACG